MLVSFNNVIATPYRFIPDAVADVSNKISDLTLNIFDYKAEEEPQLLELPDRILATAPSLFEKAQEVALKAATVYLTALYALQNPNAALIASFVPLMKAAEALSTSASKPNESDFNTVKAALARQSAPISIVNPLPNLNAQIGQPLTQTINLQTDFELANPNSNLELSIQQSNGASAPSWLSVKMGDLSLLKEFWMGDVMVDLVVSGNYAYMTGNTILANIDIRDPVHPGYAGIYIRPGGGIGIFIGLKGNYAFYGTNGPIYVYDVSDPETASLKATITESFNTDMALNGNYIYIAQSGTSQNFLTIYDISNPESPIKKSVLSWPLSTTNPRINVHENSAYISDQIYLRVVDITNPSNPSLLTIIRIGYLVGTSLVNGNTLFIACGPIVEMWDITLISNPIELGYLYVGDQPDANTPTASALAFAGNYLYAFCGSKGINVINIPNWQIVTNIPTIGTTNDGDISGNNIFVADGQGGLAIIDAADRILSGTPALADRGLLLINVTASDELGNSVIEPIAIHVGDINVLPIPNQQVYVGNSTLFTFDAGTFEFPKATFNYKANLIGELPLPSCISFDSGTRTFIFAPRSGDQNTYRIEVTADDGYGGTESVTFDLAVPDRFPVVQQPLSNQTAYTGEPFVYAFSSSTFTDVDNDILAFSARSLGGSTGLPGWLNFDPVLRKFYGTPFGKAEYPIEVTANDGYGGTVSNVFTITVPNSAPILLNPPGTQLASVGIPFSYTFNTNTFYDVDNDPLTYSADQIPNFLTFNPATRTFSGMPLVSDVGSYQVILQAQDSAGEKVSTTISLTVLSSSSNNPPVLIKSIPDATEKSGVPFSFSFDSSSFVDPEGDTLIYQATLEGGTTLPEGLYFDSDTRTLSGVLQQPQSLRITIRAVDPYGAFAVDTFTLNIIDSNNYPPIVLNPLPNVVATVGQNFYFRVPDSTFADVNNDPLMITILQANGQPLPKWLHWDSATNSLSGKPGPWDTGTYQDRIIQVEVWASDGYGSVKTPFKIIVQGESFWETFIKYGVSFSSVAASGIGFWKGRSLIWNYFMKDKYRQKDPERAFVGEPFERKIALEFKKIKEIIPYHNGKALAKLPQGLAWVDDLITGTPTDKSIGFFTLCVFDHNGCINEEFDLIIKKNATDDDPVEEKSYLQTKFAAVSASCLSPKTEDEESGQRNRFGFKIKSENIMMASLLKENNEK